MNISEKKIEANTLSPKQDWELINSKAFDSDPEFIYFTETLFKTPDGKYVLNTMWLINDRWSEDSIKIGLMSPKELEPHEDYQIISDEEALAWLEHMT